ncbi:MAG: hydroxymethylpyrimidine/phosphomethylpyrimidine kinase [Planctomycetota bacterium]
MIVALTIAGSDPTGGAGLEQDLRVFAVEGVHGTAVATALTTQDTARVHEVEPECAERFARRLAVLLAEIRPRAVKAGMLGTASIARVLAEALEGPLAGVPFVLDPVLRSSSGRALLDAAGEEVLRERLLPRATITTPNRREAGLLAGLGEAGDPAEAAARLSSRGPTVFVSAGDASEPELVEHVGVGGRVTEQRATRLPGEAPHGTGCALTAFIAAGLARGETADAALAVARARMRSAIAAAELPGTGGGGSRRLLVFERNGS